MRKRFLVPIAFIILIGIIVRLLYAPGLNYSIIKSISFIGDGLNNYAALTELLMQDYASLDANNDKVGYIIDNNSGVADGIYHLGEYATVPIDTEEEILILLNPIRSILFRYSSIETIHVNPERITFVSYEGYDAIIFVEGEGIPSYCIVENDINQFRLYKLCDHWYYADRI